MKKYLMDLYFFVYQFVSQKDFIISFFSNIFSSATIAIFAAVYIKFFTSLFKQPNLILVAKQEGFYRSKIGISQRDDGDYETSFRLAIKNNGKETLMEKEGYWHVYFPNISKVEASSEATGFIAQGESGHFRDSINSPIYPKSFFDFGPEFKFKIKKKNMSNDKTYIHYFFSTSYGYFPKTVKIDKETGAVSFSTMGLLELECPK